MAGPSGETVCIQVADNAQVLQCGNVLMGIESTPWLSPEMTESDEVQDTDTSSSGYEHTRDIFHATHKGLSKSDEQTIYALSVYSYFVEVLKWSITSSLEHIPKQLSVVMLQQYGDGVINLKLMKVKMSYLIYYIK